MADITAETVLARFFYQSTDFDPASNPSETTSYTNTEYIIDEVIDFINSEAGTSISNLTGAVGSKTVTVTGPQNASLKLVLGFYLKDAKYKINESSGLGPASVSESVYSQDPVIKKMLWKSLDRLRGVSFDRV